MFLLWRSPKVKASSLIHVFIVSLHVYVLAEVDFEVKVLIGTL